MLTKPFFLDPRENANAAAVVPLRGGPKATGNSKPFLTAFFSQAQHSSLTLRSSPLWLGHGAILFSQSLCNMASQSQEDVESWPSEPPGALGGKGSLSPCPRHWRAARPCGCPLADPGEPAFWSITGCSCRADTKHQTLGIAFSPWCSEHLWERLLSLSVQSKLVCRRVQYFLFWVGEKRKTTFGFSVTFVGGSRKALSFPNLDHLKRKGHSWAIWSTWQPSCY